jgi:hypothetical protein
MSTDPAKAPWRFDCGHFVTLHAPARNTVTKEASGEQRRCVACQRDADETLRQNGLARGAGQP